MRNNSFVATLLGTAILCVLTSAFFLPIASTYLYLHWHATHYRIPKVTENAPVFWRPYQIENETDPTFHELTGNERSLILSAIKESPNNVVEGHVASFELRIDNITLFMYGDGSIAMKPGFRKQPAWLSQSIQEKLAKGEFTLARLPRR